MKKILFITVGILSVTLGVIGIFVPGLPTTPFLLLSSWLFYKSSKRLHDALHRSPWLGAYLKRFQDRRGVSRRMKLFSVGCMWTMICLSAFGYFENWHVRLLLIGLGVVGTLSVIIFVPAAKKA